MFVPFFVDKCNIKSTKNQHHSVDSISEFSPYSSPGFGGDQSPCANADVAEKARRAEDDLESCLNLHCIWVLFRAPGTAKGQYKWEDGNAVEDAARL